MGRSLNWFARGVAIAVLMVAGSTATAQSPTLLDPAALTEKAPGVFRAKFDTSKGVFVIEVTREWAPLAADRFYNLVKNGYYDGVRFHRVLAGFVVQFGLHGDPAVAQAWARADLADEPPLQQNTRGFVTFTQEDVPNTRDTQVFISYKDNSHLSKSGFPPFGRVVVGMEVVETLYAGYGSANVPEQRRIEREGNAYLEQFYPLLDYIKTARLEPAPTR